MEPDIERVALAILTLGWEREKFGGEMSWYVRPIGISIICLGILAWGWLHGGADGMPFSRAGALVTAMSLGFVLWEYARALPERESQAIEEIRKLAAEMKLPNSVGDPAVAALGKKIHIERIKLERKIVMWQATIVVIGTLVWGFGDIVFMCAGQPCCDRLYSLLYFGEKE